MRGQVKAYEYRLDGNESFEDSARVKPLALLDNYHIFYERVDGRVRIDNSDIPSREVTAYYIRKAPTTTRQRPPSTPRCWPSVLS